MRDAVEDKDVSSGGISTAAPGDLVFTVGF